MAIQEEKIVMHRTDENGNKVLQFPYVKGDNIETPVPITAGGLGSTTVDEALKALGLNATVQNLSVEGKTITVTFKDGTTKTLTTQDTAGTWVKVTKSTAFTAEYNCIAVFVHAGGENYQQVIVNGTTHYIQSHHTSHITMTLPLMAGDVVTTSNIETVWVMEVR